MNVALSIISRKTLTALLLVFVGLILGAVAILFSSGSAFADIGSGGGAGGNDGDPQYSSTASGGINITPLPPAVPTGSQEAVGTPTPPDINTFSFFVPCENSWQPNTDCTISTASINAALATKTSQLSGAPGLTSDQQFLLSNRNAVGGNSWGQSPGQELVSNDGQSLLLTRWNGYHFNDNTNTTWTNYGYKYPNSGSSPTCYRPPVIPSGMLPCNTPSIVAAQTCSPINDGYSTADGKMMATGKWFTVQVQQVQVPLTVPMSFSHSIHAGYAGVNFNDSFLGAITNVNMYWGPNAIEADNGLDFIGAWHKIKDPGGDFTTEDQVNTGQWMSNAFYSVIADPNNSLSSVNQVNRIRSYLNVSNIPGSSVSITYNMAGQSIGSWQHAADMFLAKSGNRTNGTFTNFALETQRVYTATLMQPSGAVANAGEKVTINPGSCAYPQVTVETMYCFYNYSGYTQWSNSLDPGKVAGSDPNYTASGTYTGGTFGADGSWTGYPDIYTGSVQPGSLQIGDITSQNLWWRGNPSKAGVVGFARQYANHSNLYGYLSSSNSELGTINPPNPYSYWDNSYVHISPTYSNGGHYDSATPNQSGNNCGRSKASFSVTYTIPGPGQTGGPSQLDSLGFYAVTAQAQFDTFTDIVWSHWAYNASTNPDPNQKLADHWTKSSGQKIIANTNYFARTCSDGFQNDPYQGSANIAQLSVDVRAIGADPFSPGGCAGVNHWQCELVSPTIAGAYANVVAGVIGVSNTNPAVAQSSTNPAQANVWAKDGWSSSNTNPIWLSATAVGSDSTSVPIAFSKVRIMDYNTTNPAQPPVDITNGAVGPSISLSQPGGATAAAKDAHPGIYYTTVVVNGSTPYNTTVGINDKAQYFHLWKDTALTQGEQFQMKYPDANAPANLDKTLSFVWDSQYNWGTSTNQPFIIARQYSIQGWFKLQDPGSLGTGGASVGGSGGTYWYYGEAPCYDYNQTDGSNPTNYQLNPDGSWKNTGLLTAKSNDIYVTRGNNNTNESSGSGNAGYNPNPTSYSPPNPLGTPPVPPTSHTPGAADYYGMSQIDDQVAQSNQANSTNDTLVWPAYSCTYGTPHYQVRETKLKNDLGNNPNISSNLTSNSFQLPTTWWDYGSAITLQYRTICSYDNGMSGNWSDWASAISYTTFVPTPNTGTGGVTISDNGAKTVSNWTGATCSAGEVQYRVRYTAQDGSKIANNGTTLKNWTDNAASYDIPDSTYRGARNGVTVDARCYLANVAEDKIPVITGSEHSWTPVASWAVSVSGQNVYQLRTTADGKALHISVACTVTGDSSTSSAAIAPGWRVTWSASVWSAAGYTWYDSGSSTSAVDGSYVTNSGYSVMNLGSPYSGYSFSASCATT